MGNNDIIVEKESERYMILLLSKLFLREHEKYKNLRSLEVE